MRRRTLGRTRFERKSLLSKEYATIQEKSVGRSCQHRRVDALSDLLRDGGVAELDARDGGRSRRVIDHHPSLKGKDGHRLVVRYGYLSSHTISTGFGPVEFWPGMVGTLTK